MTQNDFLRYFLNLPPLVAVLTVWLWGFGSLFFYGMKTKAIRSVVLKTPGIIIGDFFLIPTLAFLIVYFYKVVENPLPATTSLWWTLTTCLIAFILAMISAIRFDLVNSWFFPHIVFYWFMAYILLTFLTKGFYQLIFGGSTPLLWAVWTIVLIGIIVHISLGVIWPKRFPLIG